MQSSPSNSVAKPWPKPWLLQDAKAQFSALVDHALRGVPQHVTRRGKQAVVVLSQSDFDALQRSAGKPSKDNSNFIDHLLAIPKRPPSKRSSPRLQGVQGSQKEKEAFEVEFPRLEITLREVDFS